jgi:hypothetical protein
MLMTWSHVGLAAFLVRPVRSSSGYRSMSVVSVSFWHVAGTVRPLTYADSYVIVCRDYRDMAVDAEPVVEAAP